MAPAPAGSHHRLQDCSSQKQGVTVCSLIPSAYLHSSFQFQPTPALSAHKHMHVLAQAAARLSVLRNYDSTDGELSKIAVGAQLFPTIA